MLVAIDILAAIILGAAVAYFARLALVGESLHAYGLLVTPDVSAATAGGLGVCLYLALVLVRNGPRGTSRG